MKKLLIVAAAIGVYVACKKSENTPDTNLVLTKTNLAGTYLATDATFTDENGVSTSLFNIDTLYPKCKRDDEHIFDTTGASVGLGVYTNKDVGDSCTNPPKTTSGPCIITTSNQITFGGVTYLVEKLTTTELVVAKDTSFTYYAPPSTSIKINGRFKAYFKRK